MAPKQNDILILKWSKHPPGYGEKKFKLNCYSYSFGYRAVHTYVPPIMLRTFDAALF